MFFLAPLAFIDFMLVSLSLVIFHIIPGHKSNDFSLVMLR